MISEKQKQEILKAIECRFENILNYSLKVIDKELECSISIIKKDVFEDDDVRQPKTSTRTYTGLGLVNIISTDPYSSYISSDLGDYYVTVLVNNWIVEIKGLTQYVRDIINYIIDQCKIYLRIDLEGLFKYIEDEEKVKQAIKKILEGDFSDYIDYCLETNDYEKHYIEINKKHIYYFNTIITGGNHNSNIIQHLNIISSTPYEGAYNKAKLVIFKNLERLEAYINKNKENVIEFNNVIKLNDYKSVRKALEMSSDEWVVVSDCINIYGLSKMENTLIKEATVVNFIDYYEYSISLNSCKDYNYFNIELNDVDTINFSETYNINFKYGNPINNQEIDNLNNGSNLNIMDIISLEFENLREDEKYVLEGIIDAVKNQKKGSMLVISNKAQIEAEHLRYQSTLIKPKKLTKELVQKISCIDGSILINEYGECYAIGVILDGPACKYGDKSRGARYNSAIKYIHDRVVNKKENLYKCIAIVKSEDGMIDVISRDIFKEKYEIIDDMDDSKINLEKELNMNDNIDNLKCISRLYYDCFINYIYKKYIKSIGENNFELIYEKINMLHKSIQYYSEAIERDNKNVDLYYYRARIYYKLANKFKLKSKSKFDEYISNSITDLNKSIELMSNFAYAEYSNIFKEEIEEYIKIVNRLKESDDKYIDENCYNEIDIIAEIEKLDIEIENNNSEWDLYYHRANKCYILIKSLEDLSISDEKIKLVLKDLEKAKQLNKNEEKIWESLGVIYSDLATKQCNDNFRDDLLSTALKNLDVSIRLNQDFANSYAYRATVYYQLGVKEKSKVKLKKLLEKSLKDIEKSIRLNEHYSFLHKQAYKLCSQLIELENEKNKCNILIQKRNIHKKKCISCNILL